MRHNSKIVHFEDDRSRNSRLAVSESIVGPNYIWIELLDLVDGDRVAKQVPIDKMIEINNALTDIIRSKGEDTTASEDVEVKDGVVSVEEVRFEF